LLHIYRTFSVHLPYILKFTVQLKNQKVATILFGEGALKYHEWYFKNNFHGHYKITNTGIFGIEEGGFKGDIIL